MKMMSSSEVSDIRNAGEDINSELRIETHKLDTIENGGVNLQCVNSSEFMVGKQTNFNGPVTIINCTDGNEPEGFRGRLPGTEEVVIKDRIMTPTVAASVGSLVKNTAQKEKLERRKNIRYIAKETCSKNFLKIPVFVWSMVLFIFFAAFITIITEFYIIDRTDGEPSFLTVNGQKFRFVCRKEWGAVEGHSIPRLTLPVPYVVISHTATASCYSLSECSSSVRNMQMSNINKKNLPDIKYNFLVGGDGLIYEGRGWYFRSESKGRVNNQNIDIAFIGNFVFYVLTASQIETVKALIAHASAMNCTTEDYSLIPANMTCATLSPGKYVVLVIQDDYFPDDVEIFQGDGMNHTFFRRRHWKAAPEESSVLVRLPVKYVIISSTGSENCTSLRKCKTILQRIQKKQMKKTGSDIYSNFLVSGDGSIFEGRGWEKRSAFQGFANNQNIEINCIGDFVVYEHPTNSQIDAIETLIHYGIKYGKISETYYLIPANATGISLEKDKPSIGKNLYEMIKNMERFESKPYSLLFPNSLDKEQGIPFMLNFTVRAVARVSKFNLDVTIVQKSLPIKKTLSTPALVPGQYKVNSTRIIKF